MEVILKNLLLYKHLLSTVIQLFKLKSYRWTVLLNNIHLLVCYLGNRKHVPCFYQVIETRVEVWKNEKCCGNTSRRWLFPQLFWVLPNFHECFYNTIETRSTCFLFLLETLWQEKGRQLVNFDYQNVNSLCSRHRYVKARAGSLSPSSYTNTIFNQSARVLS